MTLGIGEHLQAAACGAERWVQTMKQPIPPKYGSACALAILPSCARVQAAAKPKVPPQDKRMSLHLKLPKLTQPSVLLPPLAIPSDSRSMTANRLECEKRAERLCRQLVLGFSVQRPASMKQASNDRVNLPRRFATA